MLWWLLFWYIRKYLQSFFNKFKFKTKACDSSCSVCYGPLITNCYSCIATKKFISYNTECVNACPWSLVNNQCESYCNLIMNSYCGSCSVGFYYIFLINTLKASLHMRLILFYIASRMIMKEYTIYKVMNFGLNNVILDFMKIIKYVLLILN